MDANARSAGVLPAGPRLERLEVVAGGPLLDEGQALVDAQAVPAVVEVGRARSASSSRAGRGPRLEPLAPLDVSTPRSSVIRYSWKATRFRSGALATSARRTLRENSWSRRGDVDVRDAADRDPVIVVAFLVDVHGHLGRPIPKTRWMARTLSDSSLTWSRLRSSPTSFSRTLRPFPYGLDWGMTRTFIFAEERLQVPEREVPDEPERRLLGRLLVAVLGGRQEERGLGPVEGRGSAAPFAVRMQRKMSRPA